MSAESNRCPKCDGEMVQGFTFESEGPKRMVSTWVEGAPDRSFWHSGAKVPAGKCVPVGIPMFGLRIPGVLRAAGVRREVTPPNHRLNLTGAAERRPAR